MNIKPISSKQTLKLIDKFPYTNDKGYDDVNNKIMKHLEYELEPVGTTTQTHKQTVLRK